MSIQAMAWVFDKAPADLKPSETLTLLSLANHANGEGGYAYPSVGRIAKEVKIGQSTVREALQSLIARNIIEQVAPPTSRKPAIYAFMGVNDPGWMPTLLDAGVPESGGVPKSGTPKSGTLDPQNLAPRGAESGTLDPQNLAPNHHITKKEPSNNHQGEAAPWEGDFETAPTPSGTRPVPSRDMAQSNVGPQPRSVQSSGGSDREQELSQPYWQGAKGDERRETFNYFVKQYPQGKVGDIAKAAASWRDVVRDQADSPDGTHHAEFTVHLFKALEDWNRHWATFKPEEQQFIPYLSSFIRKEKWRERPGTRRSSPQ